MLAVGIIASILLAIGLLPPYWEIWKRKGRVIGISWVRGETPFDSGEILTSPQVFLTIDWFGAFFSLMALGKSDSQTGASAPETLGQENYANPRCLSLVAQNTFDIQGGVLYIMWSVTVSILPICVAGLSAGQRPDSLIALWIRQNVS